jgi:acetyltransferase-like isoleucine patch superfamily enzyme
MKSVTLRLSYLKYLFRAGFWRWLAHGLDHLVMDHIEPWLTLRPGSNAMIHPNVSFRCAENVEIGPNTRIQYGCVLWASPNARIRIGDNTGLGPGVMIYSSNHGTTGGGPYIQQPWTEEDVTVGCDVWIGSGSILLPGVTIGDHCVVAAGSVVTRSMPAGSVVAGVPARPIRSKTEAA